LKPPRLCNRCANSNLKDSLKIKTNISILINIFRNQFLIPSRILYIFKNKQKDKVTIQYIHMKRKEASRNQTHLLLKCTCELLSLTFLQKTMIVENIFRLNGNPKVHLLVLRMYECSYLFNVQFLFLTLVIFVIYVLK
jgi:hypothetical protein